MPSILSNALCPVTMDTKTGQTGLEPAQPDYRTHSQLASYQEEDLINHTSVGDRLKAGESITLSAVDFRAVI